MNASLKQAVREAFAQRCAYCCSPEALVAVTFEIEHIVPVSLGGDDSPENLCLACPMCNRHKANRTEGIDLSTGAASRLFHPRREVWTGHFDWDPPAIRLVGLTPVGRATIDTLRMNRDAIVELRELWTRLGVHPPA